MKTGPRLAALFALLVSWLNSRLDSLVVAMKAVLNVETYLHCSQDLRGTQHGLWPGLSPNLHLSDYGRVARHPPGTKPISLLAQQDRRINRERALRRNPRRYQPEQAHSQHSAS